VFPMFHPVVMIRPAYLSCLVKNAVDIWYRDKHQWSPLINHTTTPEAA
jgi:hypothetical protein